MGQNIDNKYNYKHVYFLWTISKTYKSSREHAKLIYNAASNTNIQHEVIGELKVVKIPIQQPGKYLGLYVLT
jgi:hypothetical protein